MKPLLLIALMVVLVGSGLKMAGVPLPLVDYPIGPMGIDTPGMPDVEVDAPGFDEFEAP